MLISTINTIRGLLKSEITSLVDRAAMIFFVRLDICRPSSTIIGIMRAFPLAESVVVRSPHQILDRYLLPSTELSLSPCHTMPQAQEILAERCQFTDLAPIP
jgi:hypothetical protein